MSDSPPRKVFISYSHEAEEHDRWVLQLADRLRKDGVDAWLDRYILPPPEGWIRWMQTQIETSDCVILVCTPTFRRRFEGRDSDAAGGGVTWEGLLANQILYDDRGHNRRFIPVLPSKGTYQDVPLALRPYQRHYPDSEYDALLRHVLGRPEVAAPPLGQTPVERQPVRSTGLVQPPPAAPGSAAEMTLQSPLHCRVAHAAVICTRAGPEASRWKTREQSQHRLLDDSREIAPPRAFLVLVESKTDEAMSLVAHTRMLLKDVIEGGESVRAGAPIGTLLIPNDNVRHPPFSFSRGQSYSGILKYVPWIGDPVWQVQEGWPMSPEQPFKIVAHRLREQAGILCLMAPAAGFFCPAEKPYRVGCRVSANESLGTVVQGSLEYPVLAARGGVLISGAPKENEAVYIGQELFRLRVGAPVLDLTIQPAHAGLHESWYVMRSPLTGRFLPEPDDLSLSSPGGEFKAGQPLCQIDAGDVILAVALDVDGVVMELFAEKGSDVEFGARLMLIQARRVFMRSPMYGNFYRAPEPGEPPYVNVGDRVRKGQTVCIIEALKVKHYIESEGSGVVTTIHVEDSQSVEYGEPLFVIEQDTVDGRAGRSAQGTGRPSSSRIR